MTFASKSSFHISSIMLAFDRDVLPSFPANFCSSLYHVLATDIISCWRLKLSLSVSIVCAPQTESMLYL